MAIRRIPTSLQVAFAVASVRLIASVRGGLLGVTDRLRRIQRVLSQTCFVEDAVTKARWAALAASGQLDDPYRHYLFGRTIVLQFQEPTYVIECNRHGFNIVRLCTSKTNVPRTCATASQTRWTRRFSGRAPKSEPFRLAG